MSAAAHTDSGLSGQPSSNIDKQTGPATGSNAESPGGTLGTATTAVKADNNNPSNQGQSGQNGNNNPSNQGDQSGNNNQQQNPK